MFIPEAIGCQIKILVPARFVINPHVLLVKGVSETLKQYKLLSLLLAASYRLLKTTHIMLKGDREIKLVMTGKPLLCWLALPVLEGAM